MRLSDILAEERVAVVRGLALKAEAIERVASLLALGTETRDQAVVRAVLEEREGLQSTGIGDGIAIPHGFLGDLDKQIAALLVVQEGVPFEAIDARPAKIILGVIGPKKGMHAQVEHLRILARVSRLLREPALREKLVHAASAHDVFETLREADGKVP
jgi:PTS system nitrogen regulatory IIA component